LDRIESRAVALEIDNPPAWCCSGSTSGQRQPASDGAAGQLASHGAASVYG
jgi:hypothetical protein